MNNPYRIHSTICVNILQLLMMSTLAYPQPTPPLFHNIAVARIASTTYLGFFPTSRVSLFIDCFTMTLKIINDALYIRYIVSNYTYIFGILDIVSDILFIYTVLVDNESTAAISRKITSAIAASAAYCGCKFNYDKTSYSDESAQQQQEPYMRYSREYNESRKHYVYSTIPITPPIASLQTSPQAPPPSPRIDHQPLATHMTTFSSDGRVNTRPAEYAPRQINPFKSNFYKSTQSPEYEQEYENIVTQNTMPAAPAAPTQAPRNYPNPNPNTMYVNFDEYDHGASNYANTFVSPYFDSNGSPITANLCTHETLFIVGNILHFIYQIMIYINIINTCKTYTSATIDPEAAATMGKMTRLLC